MPALFAAVALAACSSPTGEPTPVPIDGPAAPIASASQAAGCPQITRDDPGTSVGTFREPGGGCLARSSLLAYRCAPARDPVLVRSAGSDDPRRFLGGGYAVPVHRLPEEARELGHAPGARVYTVPHEPAHLYVDEQGSLSRWLALPAAQQLPSEPSAFLIGDSILLGSQPYVEAQLEGWQTTVDAEDGRSSLSGVAIAEARAAVPPSPTVVVVELGTNDADPVSFGANARQILASFPRARLLVWVNVHSPAEPVPEVNAQIRAAVAPISRASVADWLAEAPPNAFSSDEVHLAAGREEVFANFLTPLLQGWRAAVTGRGATECAATIEEAAA